jgi:hypothetical protein
MRPDHAFWRLWAWPIGLAALTGAGLISALFSDGGLGDVLAWIALGAPVAVGVWYGWCCPAAARGGHPNAEVAKATQKSQK